MKRFFRLLLASLAMLTVALLSAFITMRIAIHGREVLVPDLSNLSLEEASAKAAPLGLNLTLDNRYYSTTTPAGRILQQYPAPGARVRRQWVVRVTQSLGPQKVAIPDVVGQPMREATINIRRGSLDLGSIAHLTVPGDPDRVLAQSPPPNAEGVDKPSVSLLISDAESEETKAWVMPNLSGLTLLAAGSRVSAMGMHVTQAQELNTPIPAVGSMPAPAAPLRPATVVAQSPAAGSRVTSADPIKLTIAH